MQIFVADIIIIVCEFVQGISIIIINILRIVKNDAETKNTISCLIELNALLKIFCVYCHNQ